MLDDVSVNSITVLLGSALDLDGFEETEGQSIVIDTSAGTESSFDDFWVWDNVVVVQLGES